MSGQNICSLICPYTRTSPSFEITEFEIVKKFLPKPRYYLYLTYARFNKITININSHKFRKMYQYSSLLYYHHYNGVNITIVIYTLNHLHKVLHDTSFSTPKIMQLTKSVSSLPSRNTTNFLLVTTSVQSWRNTAKMIVVSRLLTRPERT
jgi:hypothetical protein